MDKISTNNLNQLIEYYILKDNQDKIHSLLQELEKRKQQPTLYLITLIKNKDWDTIDPTKLKDCDLTAQDNYILKELCYENQVQLLTKFFQEPIVDPFFDNYYLLRLAAELGHHQIVELILSDHRMDSIKAIHSAMNVAVNNNQSQVVLTILNDQRFDPTDTQPLYQSIANGYQEILELLLKYPGISLDQLNQYHISHPILEACQKGYIQTVKYLLSKTYLIYQTQIQHELIIRAVKSNNLEMVETLWTFVGWNNLQAINTAVETAATYNHLKILNFFLSNKVDPELHYNKALGLAIYNRHLESIKRLMQYPHLNPVLSNYYPLRMACNNQDDTIIKLLVTYCHHFSEPEVQSLKRKLSERSDQAFHCHC